MIRTLINLTRFFRNQFTMQIARTDTHEIALIVNQAYVMYMTPEEALEVADEIRDHAHLAMMPDQEVN